jgi:hypothetical protein
MAPRELFLASKTGHSAAPLRHLDPPCFTGGAANAGFTTLMT